MNINLRIDRMILDGVNLPPEGQADFQAALETELSSLLSTHGLQSELAAGGAFRVLSAGTIQAFFDHDPVGLGQQIARAIYGGIGR